MIDQALVISVAGKYGLDVALLNAQIQVESAGDPFALRYEINFYHTYLKNNEHALSKEYGPLGACSYGLMQIILEVAMELGFGDRPEKLFVPNIGLAYGAAKMQSLLKWSNNDYDRALSAYNAGKGSPFNHIYVNKVHIAEQQIAQQQINNL